jgi:hypothetical protein
MTNETLADLNAKLEVVTKFLTFGQVALNRGDIRESKRRFAHAIEELAMARIILAAAWVDASEEDVS